MYMMRCLHKRKALSAMYSNRITRVHTPLSSLHVLVPLLDEPMKSIKYHQAQWAPGSGDFLVLTKYTKKDHPAAARIHLNGVLVHLRTSTLIARCGTWAAPAQARTPRSPAATLLQCLIRASQSLVDAGTLFVAAFSCRGSSRAIRSIATPTPRLQSL
jgi:hypothetical protein